jgi:hypothetical protein
MESNKMIKDMTPEERKKYNREKMMEWRRRKSPLKYNKV